MAVAIWLITTLWPPKSCEDRMSGVECAHEIQRL
jgi:hypothetical protein